MRKTTVFKKLLLITQEETAVLLGITRSQWAMYAIGQRGLSVKGQKKLEQLITRANKVSFSKKQTLLEVKIQESEIKKELEKALLDNKLKQLQIQKKLSQMEEKFQLALNTIHFVISIQTEKAEWNVSESVLQVLKTKANKVLKANGLPKQEVCKIKLETFLQEEKLLNKRMKKL